MCCSNVFDDYCLIIHSLDSNNQKKCEKSVRVCVCDLFVCCTCAGNDFQLLRITLVTPSHTRSGSLRAENVPPDPGVHQLTKVPSDSVKVSGKQQMRWVCLGV